MDLRYMGFDQTQNRRVYKFDYCAKGVPPAGFLVSADIALFLKHHISIQDGPSLCARKLANDIETLQPGEHELTNDDMLAFATDRAAAEARKAEQRKSWTPRRNPNRPPPPDQVS
jgi:hypothetical protein